MAPEPVHPLKLASVLLQYPTTSALDSVAGLDPAEIAPCRGRQAQRLASFLDWYRGRPVGDLQGIYVETFDFAKQRSLHLTYHLHGDSRQRGLALLRLKEAYAAEGLEGDAGELPDFLPLMLEFCALAPEPPAVSCSTATARRSSWSATACTANAAPSPISSTRSSTAFRG